MPAKIETSTVTSSTTPPAPTAAIPRIEDHPAVAAASENVTRLKLMVAKLERERDDVQARFEARRSKESDAERLLKGTSLADLGSSNLEGEHARLGRELRTARAALELAQRQLPPAIIRAKPEVFRSYWPTYKQLVWAAALAMLDFARKSAVLDDLNEQLACQEARGAGGPDSPLPAFPHGDPTDSQSWCAQLLRQLVDDGFISEKETAGLAVAPKPRPSPPPAPPALRATRRMAKREVEAEV